MEPSVLDANLYEVQLKVGFEDVYFYKVNMKVGFESVNVYKVTLAPGCTLSLSNSQLYARFAKLHV